MQKTQLRVATEAEIERWDELLLANPDGGEILQTKTMATVKQGQGWQPEFWVYETSFGNVYATVLTRRVFPLGRLCYILRGPGVTTGEQFQEICELNKSKSGDIFMVKMEPTIRAEVGEVVENAGLKKVLNIQPNASTVLVDLTKSEDEIWASFRQRARRFARAATKEGVFAKKVELTDENAEEMFRLYQETGERAGFFVRPKEYYRDFWQKFAQAGEGSLYFAFAPDEKEPLAGAFICHSGKKGLYKDGGSRRSKYKHFAHLLQWEIMKDLKENGVEEYDLHGVPPKDKLDDKNHPMAGLAMFKMSFNKEVTEFVGAFDQILNPTVYSRWLTWGQRLHQVIAHRLRHTTFY